MTTEQEAYNSLASAIILQAVRDYERALIQRNDKAAAECEKFFESSWFEMLNDTGATGDGIIRDVKRKTELFEKIARGKISNREVKRHSFVCPVCGDNVSIRNLTIKDERYYFCKCDGCKLYLKVKKKR